MIKEFIKTTGLLNLHKPDKKREDRNSDFVELTRKSSDFSNLQYYADKFSKGAKKLGLLHKDDLIKESLERVRLFKSVGGNIVEEALLFNYRLILEMFFDRENFKPIINNQNFYKGMPSLESVFDYIQSEEQEELNYLFDTSPTNVYRWKNLKSKLSTGSLVKIKKSLEERLEGDGEDTRKRINTYILLIHLSLCGTPLEKLLDKNSIENFENIKRKVLTVTLYFSVKENEEFIPARFELREHFKNKDHMFSLHKSLISSAIDMIEFPILFLTGESPQQIVDAVPMKNSYKNLI